MTIVYKQGSSSPCAFYHPKLRIRTVVHGDDVVSEGNLRGLQEMDKLLRKHFDIKTEVLGPDAG